MGPFSLTWSVFRRSKARTLFTILSVATAFAIFSVLAALHHGVSGQISFSVAQRLITSNAVVGAAGLPVSYAERIRAVPGMKAVTYYTGFNGAFQSAQKRVSVLGFSPDIFAVYPEFTLPPEVRQAFATDRQAAVVGAELARQMGWRVGQTIPIQDGPTQKNGDPVWYFHLVGIYQTNLPAGYRSFFVAHYDYLNDGFADPRLRNVVDQFNEMTVNAGDVTGVARRIDGQFSSVTPAVSTRTQREMALSTLRQFGDVTVLVICVGAAVFFSMLLITGNTMANSVRERMSQFAVMRVLGFETAQLSALVMRESLILVGLGAVLGLLAGAAICRLLTPVVSQVLESFAITAAAMLLGLVLAALFAVVSTLIPGLRLFRMPLAQTLRGA